MTNLPTPSSLAPTKEAIWTPPPPPPSTELIFDDGVPLESNRHRLAMNLLIDTVYAALAPREDFFAGGNMFIYYSATQVKSREFRGPDFFVALDIDGSYPRQGWVVWEEAGKYPDVIVELISPTTAQVDLTLKKDLYEQTFHSSHYFVYDPFSPQSLQGWILQNGRYVELQPNAQGWLWCDALGLWLGTWSGEILRESAEWLRFYDPQGQLVLLPREQEGERADSAEERATSAEERADQAQAQAASAQERATSAEQRADSAEERAVQAETALEAQRQQQEKLRAKLLELGIDPDQLTK
ncbi:MAG: Uma2 family endonuclease [Cyanobacteria bacterium P01_G01_bin.54]